MWSGTGGAMGRGWPGSSVRDALASTKDPAITAKRSIVARPLLELTTVRDAGGEVMRCSQQRGPATTLRTQG